MKPRFSILLCALGLSLSHAMAAGLDGPEDNVPQRLVAESLRQDVPASDPRVAATRKRLAQAMQRTGKSEQAVAAASQRLARYIFDVAKVRVDPLEVLDAIATHAPVGKPLNETTQRYFDLRTRDKLGHAEAMAAMAKWAAGK